MQVPSHERQYKLTIRESEVIVLMANGDGNKAIGEQLHIKTSSVKMHVYNIFRKLGIHQRVEVIQWYKRQQQHD